MAKICRWFAVIWTCVVAASVLLAVIGRISTATTIWQGLSDVLGWFSPFNLWNWGLLFVLLLPALGAYLLAERLQQQARQDTTESRTHRHQF